MIKKGVWLLGIIAAGIIFFVFDPSVSALFPKCPFRTLTGLQCPGCGSQRAIHALLHLDIASAFHYNALLVLSLPLIALLFLAEVFRKRRPDLYARIHRPALIWGYFCLTLLWWVGRNIWQV